MDKQGKQITIKNVPPDVLKEAQKKAIDEDKSISEIVREMLEAYAKKKPQPTK